MANVRRLLSLNGRLNGRDRFSVRKRHEAPATGQEDGKENN